MRYHKPSDQCKNIYRFIRLVLGEEISDREIARKWGMDEKNLRELKGGLRAVPKLARLESLAQALGIRRYYILEAAMGVPAEKVFRILRSRSWRRNCVKLKPHSESPCIRRRKETGFVPPCIRPPFRPTAHWSRRRFSLAFPGS